jgi:hypothetical protein
VLAFGKDVSDEDPIDRSKISDVTDLHYLSHFIIRCFEENPSSDDVSPDAAAVHKRLLSRNLSNNAISSMVGASSPNTAAGSVLGRRYTVEVLFSPGVQCRDHCGLAVPPDQLRESQMIVAPPISICKQSVCSLEDFDTYLTEILAEFGKLTLDATGAGAINLQSPKMR